MTVTISVQTVITAFAFISALVGLVVFFAKAVRWFDRQKKQDKELHTLEDKHNEDMKAVQKELAIITRGQLACLKGLQEKGCNGPVTDAIKMLEEYLNTTAHEQ
ncbi:MAG: hypothetical protein IKK92_01980 [Prevotella sp.]|nr:hypothetical protein [Prevotella sp.]